MKNCKSSNNQECNQGSPDEDSFVGAQGVEDGS